MWTTSVYLAISRYLPYKGVNLWKTIVLSSMGSPVLSSACATEIRVSTGLMSLQSQSGFNSALIYCTMTEENILFHPYTWMPSESMVNCVRSLYC